MLTFDKLKLVTRINDIEILDESQFNVTYQNGIMTTMKFYQDVPFLLMIKIDYVCSELVIEFTGKILKSEYKKCIYNQLLLNILRVISQKYGHNL